MSARMFVRAAMAMLSELVADAVRSDGVHDPRYKDPRDARLEVLEKEAAELRATVAALKKPPEPASYASEPMPKMEPQKAPTGSVVRKAVVGEAAVLLVAGPGVSLYANGTVDAVDDTGASVAFKMEDGSVLLLHVPHGYYSVVETKYTRKLGPDENVWTDIDAEARKRGEATPDPLVGGYAPGVFGDPERVATPEELAAQARRFVGLKPKEPAAPQPPAATSGS